MSQKHYLHANLTISIVVELKSKAFLNNPKDYPLRGERRISDISEYKEGISGT